MVGGSSHGYLCRQISIMVKLMESPLVPNTPASQVSLFFKVFGASIPDHGL